MTALREQHNLNSWGKSGPLKIGDVAVICLEEKTRGKWSLGILEELFEGRDGPVQAVKLRAGKTSLERSIQHLYPLELTCDNVAEGAAAPTDLKAEAPVFRPWRDAVVAANFMEDGEL